MIEFAKKYGKNILTSQFGEEGILLEVIKRIGLKPGVCVEFGGHDSRFCSNTRLLADEYGWTTRMFDINPQSPLVEKREITPENVNNLPACSLLSIDTDGPCYWIWKAYKGLPDIVIIEINSSYSPHSWHVPGPAGCSYLPCVSLGLEKGYFLLAHTGNCIFLLNKHRELFPEIEGDGIGNCELYFNTDHLPK
jgi:hypothetical protein